MLTTFPSSSTHVRTSLRSRGQQAVPSRFEVVVICISTGGPVALTVLLEKLSPNIKSPIVIVQHMPTHFTAWLAERLNEVSRLKVKEAEDGEKLQVGTVYLAPGGVHTKFERQPKTGVHIVLSDEAPVRSCRPSVDVLFQSASKTYKNGVLAVVMTGMGRDGCDGVSHLKQRIPTYCLTQEASSCVVYGMPKAVVEAHLSDEALSLEGLAHRISELASQ